MLDDDDSVSAPPLRPPLANTASPRDKEPQEFEKVAKWQQQRIERKLRGEYESAVLHLAEVVNGNRDAPISVSSVRVEGAHNTRKAFLGSILAPYLARLSEKPTSLDDVLYTTRQINDKLHKTDIFKSISTLVDRPQDPARPGDVDLVFKTKERGRWYLSSSTELGNNEGSASASARIRNVFGGAETFEANVSLGTKTRRAFRGSLTAPITPDLATIGELAVYGLESDFSTFASCTEAVRGLKASIRNGVPHRGVHEVSYEAALRHIANLAPTASISIREAAGLTLKSSINHSFLIDTRDDKIAATRGFYAKLYHELAGTAFGGDAQFYKVQTEGQLSRKLGSSGFSISLAARTGIMWGLGSSGQTLFSDRFQLGGPNSVRSFKMNSLGPRDGGDALGGQFYYSAGLSLISDIPNKAHWPVKPHLWINAGRLDALNHAAPLSDSLRSSFSQPSISAGLGLIYRFDPVRVEMNIGVPLAASKSDGTRKGVQVGMGIEFL